ncbi:hypothetical protein PVAND_006637 [Polypedilum vanderplanki]|uniref:Phosphoglucomutase n=1 Tax=Polypedilum vanderplanki TaxID=319348 RepID=A0A9J6C5H4_POLVA|nr:hypothetical protein PVAND_006637 [Polypedilum vanderplanki]
MSSLEKDIKINSGNVELDEKIQEWIDWDKNEKTLDEIKSLVLLGDYETLKKRLLCRMAFGTAGLRGKMQAGFSFMNDLVIVQTGQGLVTYIKKCFPNKVDQQRGVVISYDGRYNSRRFAELTATIFINENIPVYFYSKLTATPFVPFAVYHKKALCGIMVTASHNPKEDNGYKVYWENSAQIISPHDKNIQNSILKNLNPLPSSWKTEEAMKSSLLHDPYDEMFKLYFDKLQATIPPKFYKINEEAQLKIVYTAMHGVGYPFVQKAYEISNLKPVHAVIEQRDPDPEFPTVKFPNPEEGKSCLVLSMKLADEVGSDLIIANDPDADRLAVAERDSRTKEWKVFNGNEIGSLLGWWSVKCFKEAHPNVDDMKNCYLLASTVSSKMLKSMGKKEGFNFEETLTGFKYMGNRSVEFMEKGNQVLFAFEEAIGFMVSSNVLDKDGVSAAAHLGTMASYMKLKENKTLCETLEYLYKMYGYHYSLNSYFLCYEPEKIIKIFERIRNWKGEKDSYPSSIGNYKIDSIRDLTAGIDTSQPNRKPLLPSSKSSQMITFTFENDTVLTLRTSGTEPKIKYYSEYCAKPDENNWKEIQDKLKDIVDKTVNELLQPTENGLIQKSD